MPNATIIIWDKTFAAKSEPRKALSEIKPLERRKLMLEINAARLLNDLNSLAAIGQTSDGGVSRMTLSPADIAGRTWFHDRMIETGLHFSEDGAGNYPPCWVMLAASSWRDRTWIPCRTVGVSTAH